MLKIIFKFLFLLPILMFSQSDFTFKSEGMNIKVKKIASQMGVVWGMSSISKDEIIFTKKSGEIGSLNLKTKKIKYFLNRPNVSYSGQGGLLDVQKGPNFKQDRILFFTYVKKIKGEGVTVLASAKFINNDLYEWKDLLITKSSSDTTRHFGSRITFDNNGHLFFSIGDRGVRPNGQDLTSHAGSIIRLKLDGSIPLDNPFVNDNSKLPEIYSYGHRNPQGVFYDTSEEKLWIIEHGPRGGDEINLIKKGLNYGWPIISYGKEYWNPLHVGEGTHRKGMEQPIKYYVPSIAPSSLIVYRGESFSKWNGSLLSGALKLRHINRIVLDKKNKVIKEERLLENLNERIRNIIQTLDDDILISTDNGNIYKLTTKRH